MSAFGKNSRHTEESKAKMSKAHLGKKHSEESKAKMTKIKCSRGHLLAETRKTHPNGDTYCSACKKIRYDAFRKSNKEKIKKYNRRAKLKANYGLSEANFDELFEKQGGKCAICLKEPEDKALHVDHDHRTDAIRGLLCGNCNTGLGLLQDAPEIVNRALEYLKNHESRV